MPVGVENAWPGGCGWLKCVCRGRNMCVGGQEHVVGAKTRVWGFEMSGGVLRHVGGVLNKWMRWWGVRGWSK